MSQCVDTIAIVLHLVLVMFKLIMAYCHARIDNVVMASVGAEPGSFGGGTGRIWLANTECTGNEAHLLNCTTFSGEADSCSHSQDVGVMCPAGKIIH